MHLCAELIAASMMLEPLGEFGANFSLQLSSRTQFTRINNKKVFTVENQCEKHKKSSLKTYAAISNAHLSRVCKRGKLSGSCLSTLNGFGSTQLPIFLCHIGVPTFSSQNN